MPQRRWVYDEGEVGAPWVHREQGPCADDTQGYGKGRVCGGDTQRVYICNQGRGVCEGNGGACDTGEVGVTVCGCPGSVCVTPQQRGRPCVWPEEGCVRENKRHAGNARCVSQEQAVLGGPPSPAH